MTSSTENETHPPVEYTAALSHLREVYTTLLDLANIYPEALRERAGACGEWSPRQVLAHLSGWINEATRRFRLFDAGATDSIEYDDDSFNAQSVKARQGDDWQKTLDELRTLFQNFYALASKVQPQRAAENVRYQNWLTGLATDCEEHTQQLQQFAAEAR